MQIKVRKSMEQQLQTMLTTGVDKSQKELGITMQKVGQRETKEGVKQNKTLIMGGQGNNSTQGYPLLSSNIAKGIIML